MATPSFQLYADKENVQSVGRMHKGLARHGIAPVAKIFGSSNGPTGFPTPARKALGNMNRDPNVATPTFTPKQKISIGSGFKKPVLKVTGPTPIKRQPLSSRPVNVLAQQDKTLKSQKSKGASTDIFKPKSKPKSLISDDIEKISIFMDEQDDYDDIWPVKDRPSSYLDALIKWRPPCFGAKEMDEDQEEEERRMEMKQRMHEDDEKVIKYDNTEDDLPLPPVEMLPFPDVDIPLPSLDESLDIVQHIGSLSLKED